MHRPRNTATSGRTPWLWAGLLLGALATTGCSTLQPVETAPVAVVAAPQVPEPAPLPEPAPPTPIAPAVTAAELEPTAPAGPRGRLDPGQDAERLDLWERVRDNYSMPAIEGDLVRKWEQFYAGQPEYVQRMAERGGRYLFHIVEEVQKREMPVELALLPFIESAFNPQAMSRAKASGMWQFMPGTGKDFDLRQNLFRDDRRDVLASTRAALDYLGRLHKMFDDWHLALAAYNWGQGNVLRELARNRRAGKPLDYASLAMPAETRNYVPKFQAMKNIVAQPGVFALSLPPLQNHPYFLSVPIDRDIDVALAAELAGLSLDEFQQLNPQLNKPVILAAATPQVLLTYDAANRFVRELAHVKRPLSSWTAWVAPRTLKAADAAKAVGMSEARLREINQIPARMLVRLGSTLLVPRTASSPDSVAEHIADGGQLSLAQESRPPRRVSLKAGRKGARVTAVVAAAAAAPAKLKTKAKTQPNAKLAARNSTRTTARPPGPKARQTTRVAQR